MPDYVALQTETEEMGGPRRSVDTSESRGTVHALRRQAHRARDHVSNTWKVWKSQPNSSELVAIALVYLVQGVTDLAALAQKYLLKDELQASPAQVTFVISAGNVPWAIKPAIGLISDTLPLWGYRRKSYLIAAGLAGAVGWLLLALPAAWGGAGSMAGVLGLIVAVSGASAVSDVVVDSMVVERARREAQADSGSLQSLCWAAYAVGQVGSAWFSGSLVERLGPRPVFALTALLPLLVVLVGVGVRERRGPGVLELMRRLLRGEHRGGGVGAELGCGADEEEERRPLTQLPGRREDVNGEEGLDTAKGKSPPGGRSKDGGGGMAGAGGGCSSEALAPPATARPMQRVDVDVELQLGEVRGRCAEGRSAALPGSESDSDLSADVLDDEADAGAACSGGGRRRKGRRRGGGGGGRRRGHEQQRLLLQPLSMAASEDAARAAGSGVDASGSASSFANGRSGGDGGCSTSSASGSGGSSTGGRQLLTACATLCDSLRVTSLALWDTVRRREVAGPVLFLFLSSATPAADDAMFFFMTAPPPTGLGFSATFLGDVALAVAVASLAGVGVYHAFLRRLPLRRVLLWGSLLAAACQASSLVLATRANVALGLPDHLFALGDSVLVSVIQNVLFMPTMVLSARLCPPGLEATLFAGLMSVGNIATGLRYLGGPPRLHHPACTHTPTPPPSTPHTPCSNPPATPPAGALLTQLLGVTSTDFRNLPLLLALCSIALVLPLPLLLLVPASLDQDREEQGREQGGGGAAGSGDSGGGGGDGGGGGGGLARMTPDSSGSDGGVGAGSGGGIAGQLGVGGDAEVGAGVLQERRHAVH